MDNKNKDKENEGREEYFMDIDRMINEGLGGGTVNGTHAGIIEKARDLKREDPPASD